MRIEYDIDGKEYSKLFKTGCSRDNVTLDVIVLGNVKASNEIRVTTEYDKKVRKEVFRRIDEFLECSKTDDKINLVGFVEDKNFSISEFISVHDVLNKKALEEDKTSNYHFILLTSGKQYKKIVETNLFNEANYDIALEMYL